MRTVTRGRVTGTRLCVALAIALTGLAACAGAAGAQEPGDRTLLEMDTLPLTLPDDTVRLTLQPFGGPDFCDIISSRVVNDSADVAWVKRWSACADADFGDLRERTFIRVTVMGDCHATFRIDGFRSESRREYQLVVTESYGGCRAGRYHERWMVVPPLPPGWRVRLAETHVDRRDRSWPYSAPIPRTPGSISIPGDLLIP